MILEILGKEVPLELDLTDAAAVRPQVTAMFENMVGCINALSDEWTDEEADVFRLTNKLVIFRKNQYRGTPMSRSYMAQQERIFYWTYQEFVQWEPGPRRPTAYYHDAWHVRQFETLGAPPNDPEVLIDREQDAMAQQLGIATKLGCDQVLIDDLTRYANSREAIRRRLTEGVGMVERIVPHFLVV